MQIIDRYITKSIVKIFLSTILIFAFLYILIDVASNLDEIIKRKVPLEILAHYYLSFFPIIFVQTAPIACLIAVLLSYSHLNYNNEIIVLRSCGMSFWRIVKPALFLGVVISMVIFWINERFVPRAALTANEIRDANIILETDREKKKKAKIPNLTFYGVKNRLFFVDLFDPNNFTLQGVTIIGHDNDQNMKEKIVALRGRWTGIAWKFYNCQIIYFDPSSLSVPDQIKAYDEKIMDIKETPQDFIRQRIDVASMNIRQLHDYIRRFSHSGAIKAIASLRVDLHQKIAFPFGNIVIMLTGLPLAMMAGRRKAVTFTSLGIAIAIGFLFYVLNAVGLAFGKGAYLPPIVSAWVAPFFFFVIALYLIRTRF